MTLVTPVTDERRNLPHPQPNLEDGMPKSVMFETLEASPGGNCSVCGTNPATLKATGTHDGNCCLPCACNTLATLAQWTVDHRIVKTG